jgi:hypothetical protein
MRRAPPAAAHRRCVRPAACWWTPRAGPARGGRRCSQHTRPGAERDAARLQDEGRALHEGPQVQRGAQLGRRQAAQDGLLLVRRPQLEREGLQRLQQRQPRRLRRARGAPGFALVLVPGDREMLPLAGLAGRVALPAYPGPAGPLAGLQVRMWAGRSTAWHPCTQAAPKHRGSPAHVLCARQARALSTTWGGSQRRAWLAGTCCAAGGKGGRPLCSTRPMRCLSRPSRCARLMTPCSGKAASARAPGAVQPPVAAGSRRLTRRWYHTQACCIVLPPEPAQPG